MDGRRGQNATETVCGGTPSLQEILGELGAEVFDGVGLVAVGDEEGVIGLDDDEVIDAEDGDAAFLAVVEDDVVLGVELGDGAVGVVVVALGVSRYLATEIQEPTSSQSKVASMLRTREAFSMRA